MNFKIEIAQEKDLEEILTLQKIAYIQEAEIYNNYEITPLTQGIEELQVDFKTNTFIKATFNSKIIGSVKGFEENGSVLVGKLIVHPDFQNKGLGSRLMLDLESIDSLRPTDSGYLLHTKVKRTSICIKS